MVGKFSQEPTLEESKSLKDFIYLFARLYPCGDCARHFQKILARNPPDVSSRKGATQWACKVHNIVNKKLEKPQFDCSKVEETWKCGCSEDETTPI
jgi:FAD-linked sulfhydryl oxidase